MLDLGCRRQVFRSVVQPGGYIGVDLLSHGDNVIRDLDEHEDLSFANAATVVLLGVLIRLDDPERLLDVVARCCFPRIILSAPDDRIEGHTARLEGREFFTRVKGLSGRSSPGLAIDGLFGSHPGEHRRLELLQTGSGCGGE